MNKKPIPVLDEDGTIKNFMPMINKKSFRCECGANCFIKPDSNRLNLYECNDCHTRYTGE
jgi:hypothetical protein